MTGATANEWLLVVQVFLCSHSACPNATCDADDLPTWLPDCEGKLLSR